MPIEPAPIVVDDTPRPPPRGDWRFAIALLRGGRARAWARRSSSPLPPPRAWAPASPTSRSASSFFSRRSSGCLSALGAALRPAGEEALHPHRVVRLFLFDDALFATSIRPSASPAFSGGQRALSPDHHRDTEHLRPHRLGEPSAAQGYIADRTPPKQRTAGMAGFSAAFGLGAMLGPGLGGAAAAIGPLAPLYAVSGLAGVMVVILYFLLPEKTAPTPRTPRIQLRLGDRRLRPFLIFGLMFGVINAVPIQTTAFYFIDVLKFDPSVATQFAGIGLMAASMASLFSQLVLVQRFNVQPNILMRVAPALMISGHTLIIFSTDFGPMVFGLMLSGLGAGMAIPGYSAAASLSVGPDEQGAAAGLANSAGASGFIVAPIAAFGLYSVAPQAPYLLTATMAGALLAFALTSRAIRAAGVTAAAN
ncbi:MAG: MFS transporter [Parvularculaceae bacterium]